MKHILVFFALLSFYFHSPAQIKLEWEQADYDSTYNKLYSFTIDNSGNTYLAGEGNDGWSYLLIKYNNAGIRQWAVQYADSFGGWITDMAIDQFNNVCVTGITFQTLGTSDIATIKYNSGGIEEWVNKYYDTSQTFGRDEIGESIVVDDSANVYVLGTLHYSGGTPDSLLLLKYNTNGQQQWIANYVKYQIPYGDGKQIKLYNDQYLYIGTNTIGTGGKSIVLKYDLNGNLIWETELGSGGGYAGITVDKSGNVYMAENDSGNISIIKFDSSGTKLWSEATDYSGNNGALTNHFTLDINEDIIVTGRSQFYDGVNLGDSLLIMKYSSDSTLLWKKIISSDLWDEGLETTIDKDNNIYVIARFDTSNRIFKLDKDGNELWSFPVKAEKYRSGTDKIRVDSQYNIYVAGTVDFDFYVAKYSQITGIKEKNKTKNIFYAYPNPFSKSTTIKINSEIKIKDGELKLFDILGREVLKSEFINQETEINRGNLPCGIYFYQIKHNQEIIGNGKLIFTD